MTDERKELADLEMFLRGEATDKRLNAINWVGGARNRMVAEADDCDRWAGVVSALRAPPSWEVPEGWPKLMRREAIVALLEGQRDAWENDETMAEACDAPFGYQCTLRKDLSRAIEAFTAAPPPPTQDQGSSGALRTAARALLDASSQHSDGTWFIEGDPELLLSNLLEAVDGLSPEAGGARADGGAGRDTGWLIETMQDPPQWITLGPVEAHYQPCWTADSTDALRFARRIDAERFCGVWLDGEGRITEHAWEDPAPPLPARAPQAVSDEAREEPKTVSTKGEGA